MIETRVHMDATATRDLLLHFRLFQNRYVLMPVGFVHATMRGMLFLKLPHLLLRR